MDCNKSLTYQYICLVFVWPSKSKLYTRKVIFPTCLFLRQHASVYRKTQRIYRFIEKVYCMVSSVDWVFYEPRYLISVTMCPKRNTMTPITSSCCFCILHFSHFSNSSYDFLSPMANIIWGFCVLSIRGVVFQPQRLSQSCSCCLLSNISLFLHLKGMKSRAIICTLL